MRKLYVSLFVCLVMMSGSYAAEKRQLFQEDTGYVSVLKWGTGACTVATLTEAQSSAPAGMGLYIPAVDRDGNPCIWAITSNFTITRHTRIAPPTQVATMSPSSGVTLTFNVCPAAGHYRIFGQSNGSPIAGNVAFAIGTCSAFDPAWFGVLPDGTNISAAWAKFIASLPIASVANVPTHQPLVQIMPGSYLISGNPALVIPGGVDVQAHGVRFDYGAGTGVAVQIGDSAATSIGGVVQGFTVSRNFTASGTMATELVGTGIKYTNVSNAVLRDFVVTGFAKGLHVLGEVGACAYNNFYPRQFHNNLIGIHADDVGHAGFTNEINVFGGRFSTTTGWTTTTGSRFIVLDAVDNWRFYGPNLEGTIIERKLLVDNNSNFNVVYWARWEGTPASGVEIEMTAGTDGNLIFQGDAFTGSIADTSVVNNGTRNTFIGSIQWRLLSNRTILGEGQNRILGSASAANDAALTVHNGFSSSIPSLGLGTPGLISLGFIYTDGELVWFDTPGGTADTWLRRQGAGELRVTDTLFATDTVSAGAILSANNCRVRAGDGSPEAVVTGNVCDLWLRKDGGANTVLYVKESGTGNTGWVAK